MLLLTVIKVGSAEAVTLQKADLKVSFEPNRLVTWLLTIANTMEDFQRNSCDTPKSPNPLEKISSCLPRLNSLISLSTAMSRYFSRGKQYLRRSY